jgi:hypothetical protein
MAGQTYTQGQSQAALDAYNALLASGSIHAAKPPAWAVGTYQIRKPRGSGGKREWWRRGWRHRPASHRDRHRRQARHRPAPAV